MMDITPVIAQGKQVIDAYAPSHVVVAGVKWSEPILVLPDAVHRWPEGGMRAETLEQMQAHLAKVELLLCGGEIVLEDTTKAWAKEQEIMLEKMDLGAACRTYNVLLAEGRLLGAVLFF